MELKIQCPQGRAGSTPAAGIVLKTRFSDLVFYFFFQFFLSELLKITYIFSIFYYKPQCLILLYYIFTKS